MKLNELRRGFHLNPAVCLSPIAALYGRRMRLKVMVLVAFHCSEEPSETLRSRHCLQRTYQGVTISRPRDIKALDDVKRTGKLRKDLDDWIVYRLVVPNRRGKRCGAKDRKSRTGCPSRLRNSLFKCYFSRGTLQIQMQE